MNLLILHASPKKKGGASRFFSRLFRLFLPGVRKKAVSLSSRQDFQRVLELFPGMDMVCLFVPLYVIAFRPMWWNFSSKRRNTVKTILADSGCMCFPITVLLKESKIAPPCICCRRGAKGQESLGAAESESAAGRCSRCWGSSTPSCLESSCFKWRYPFSAPAPFQANCGVPLPSRYSHGFFSTAAC